MSDAQENKPNLKLWNQVSKTDPAHTKEVSFGRKFTAVDPTYQNRMATALWGPQGDKWGLRDLHYTTFTSKGWDKSAKAEFTETTMMLTATLFYPTEDGGTGLVPVAADMKFRAGDDVAKKLRTQCKSKALAELGFAADVFMGKFDDQAYVADASLKFGNQAAFVEKAMVAIRSAKTLDDLDKCHSRINKMLAGGTIDTPVWEDLYAAINERADALEGAKS